MKSSNTTLKLLFISLTISLSSCRMFDTYGWTVSRSEGYIGRGNAHDTEGNMIAFNVGWNAGTQHKAMKNMAAIDYRVLALAIKNASDMDVSRSGAVAVRETEAHPEAHTDVHVIGQGKDTPDEEDPIEPYLSMLERVLMAVAILLLGGGTAAVVKNHKSKPQAEDTTDHA